MLIDTHAHLYAEQFDEDRKDMVGRAIDQGVEKMLLPNIDCDTLDRCIALSDAFPGYCHPMIGLHPCSVDADYPDCLNNLESRLADHAWVGIGETGTDLYWDKTYREEQIKAFEVQIGWAGSMGLPLVIHSRETLEQNIQCIRKHQNGDLKGVFHCFTGTVDQALEIRGLGFYIGLGGVLTFKNSGLAEVVKELPMDFIVLETDAPYLAPTPHRGKRNESGYLPLIASRLATAKGLEVSEVVQQTTANAQALFGV